MEKELNLLKKALKDSRKREKKYRITQLVFCILIALTGVGLIIFLHFWLSGITSILMSTILYLKIYQVSKDRVKEFENFVKIVENESKS